MRAGPQPQPQGAQRSLGAALAAIGAALAAIGTALAAIGAVLAAIGTVLALVLVGPGMVAPVSASTATDQFVTISLEATESISWQNNRSSSAVVTLSAERAVSGRLQVTDLPEGGGGRTVWEYDLDLAAGSTVELPLLLTTGWNGINARAVFTADGEVLAEQFLREFPDDPGQDDGLVGLVGFGDGPPVLREIGTDYRMSTVRLDESLNGLSRVSSVVAAPEAVRELAAGPSGPVLDSWVRHGGQLVVDGRPGSLGPGYEERPTGNPNRFVYGTGSVVFAPDWRDGIPLGGVVGSAGLEQLAQTQGLGVGSAAELGLLAGLSLPSPWLIASVLLLYAVIAGPLLFGFAQGRRSPGLIWTVLPVMSLGLAALVLGVGFLARTGRSSAHVTIVEVAPDQGSRSTTDLLLVSRFGGEQTVEAGSEWEFLGQGRGLSARNLVLRPSASRLDVGANLPAGGTALVRFEGSTPSYDGWLSIDDIDSVRTAEGVVEVSATVTNASPVDLSYVVAFLGNKRQSIEDLPAGTSQRFSIEADEEELRTMGELLVWPRSDRRWVDRNFNGDFDEFEAAVPRDPDAPTAAGAWTAWRIEQGSSGIGPNTLGVVGWTEELPAPLSAIDAGRTALFVREEVPNGSDPAGGITGAFRLHDQNSEPDFFGDQGFPLWPQEYRYTLGPATDPNRLAVRLDSMAIGLSFWTPDGWRFVAELPDGETAQVAIPAEAVIDGEILFRSWLGEFRWEVGVSASVTTVPSEVAEAIEPNLVEEQRFRDGAFQEGFGPEFRGEFGMELRQIDEVALTRVDEDGGFAPLDTVLAFDFVESGGYVSVLVPVEAGERMRVTMRSAGDSYLEVRPELEPAVTNDDFGGSLDSRVEIEFSEPQMVEIRAMGLSGSETSEVELEVEVSP